MSTAHVITPNWLRMGCARWWPNSWSGAGGLVK